MENYRNNSYKKLRNKFVTVLTLINTLLISNVVVAQDLNVSVAKGKFDSTEESLKQYKCPEWFRDAKFGIWSHWGAVSVPGYIGNWYAHKMYVPGTKEYEYHLKNYGHPSVFGYKDIIALWKAERFDPNNLMDLYARAGAKYFVSMGAHHDNFDLWNSKYHEWNAVNYGPQKDIVGLWQKAALKKGLRFGVSEHFVRAYNWMNVSHNSDITGSKAGIPYDGNDPRYKGLYFEKHEDQSTTYPINPPNWWKKEWYNRIQDLIDNYKPDLVYTDGGIPFDKLGRDFMADYYNKNIKWHKGKLEAVYNYKNLDNNYGSYIEGAGVQDVEQGALKGINSLPWQTCETLAQWFWTKEPLRPKTASDIVVMLSDIVSKNGNLLLNVPQKADGTIDEWVKNVLNDIGAWMLINSEAIYGTRPWRVFGEGPSMAPFKGIRRAKDYTEKDIRFTTKKDFLYAICLGLPTSSIKIQALAGEKIRSVSVLGSKQPLKWKQESDGLLIEPLEAWPSKSAVTFKISL